MAAWPRVPSHSVKIVILFGKFVGPDTELEPSEHYLVHYPSPQGSTVLALECVVVTTNKHRASRRVLDYTNELDLRLQDLSA